MILLALYPSVQVAAVLVAGALICAVLARVTVCGVEMRRDRW